MTVFIETGSTYFEDRYLCDVGSSSITVSLKQTQWWTLKTCFEYVEKVAKKITILDQDIYSAQWLIDAGRDVPYWTEVRDTLKQERERYDTSRTQLLVAMNDFERELFIRVKSVIYVYLSPKWNDLDEKMAKSSELLDLTKALWNQSQYEIIRQKRDQLYVQRLLLDTIRRATSFDTLMVPLKTYIRETTLRQ